MNLLTNSKFIQTIWWIVAPLLVAQFFISFGMLFVAEKKMETLHVENKKSRYLYSFPKFFTTVLNHKTKEVIKSQKLENLKLKACYIEEGKEFVIINEGTKTIFVDLNKKYKGAKLIRVNTNFATFLKNGEQIKLALSKKIEPQKRDIQSTVIQTDNKYKSVQRSSFKKYIQNPQKALRDVRFQQIRENRKFAGLKLSFIRRGSLFDKMGFKKGDVIKSIDSKKLDSIMDLLPYYKSLENMTTLQISFVRDRQIKEIIYEIN